MRSLEVDPARESTYRALMRLLFMNGDRTSALRAYERCAAVIQGEFGVLPESETEALVAEIRAGRGSLSSSSRRFRS
jgi:DNA-binding SARP family transcriptional activator